MRRHERRRTNIIGRGLAALLIVAALAALFAPVGARTAAAQETPTSGTVDVQTRATFLHASPNLGEVEISLNWETKLEKFGYGDISDWVDVPPGACEVSMNAERHGFNYLVFDAVYPAPAGNDYYAIITDQLVIAGAYDRSPLPDGQARVQIVQGSISLPAVNVVATGTDVNFATQLQYPRTSDNATVPAGTYNLDVTLADSGQTALSIPNVTLSGDTVYELVIMGEASNTDHPLELKTLQDSTNPRTAESTTPTPAA